MADYYPLISRAVAGLEKNNGENRRALPFLRRLSPTADVRFRDGEYEVYAPFRGRAAERNRGRSATR